MFAWNAELIMVAVVDALTVCPPRRARTLLTQGETGFLAMHQRTNEGPRTLARNCEHSTATSRHKQTGCDSARQRT